MNNNLLYNNISNRNSTST